MSRNRREEEIRKARLREARLAREREETKRRTERIEKAMKDRYERVHRNLVSKFVPDSERDRVDHRTFVRLREVKRCFWNPKFWFLLNIGHVFGNVRITFNEETGEFYINLSDLVRVACITSVKGSYWWLYANGYVVSKRVPFLDCQITQCNAITAESAVTLFEEIGRSELVYWMENDVMPRLKYFRNSGEITWHNDFSVIAHSAKNGKFAGKLQLPFSSDNLFRPSDRVLAGYDADAPEPEPRPREAKEVVSDCDSCFYKLDWIARHSNDADADAAHAPVDDPSPVGGPGEETDPEKIAALLGKYDTNDADHADWIPETDIYEIKFKDGRKVRINAPKKEKAEPVQESGKEAAPGSVPVTEYEAEESAIEGPRPSSDGSPKETAPVIGVIQSVQTLIINNYYGKVEGK